MDVPEDHNLSDSELVKNCNSLMNNQNKDEPKDDNQLINSISSSSAQYSEEVSSEPDISLDIKDNNIIKDCANIMEPKLEEVNEILNEKVAETEAVIIKNDDIKDMDISLSSNDNSKEINNLEQNRFVNSPNKGIRRKRKSTNLTEKDPAIDSSPKNKRKKEKKDRDEYCWRCHKNNTDAQCSACPRAWHRKCLAGNPPLSLENWICGECMAILKAENAETRSLAMCQLTIDRLCMLLKNVVQVMRNYPGSKPFWNPVNPTEAPSYKDYIVKPMDLNLLEANVLSKLYGSTDAFMADAKWIQHNCFVFNTCGGLYADTSKLTNNAKHMIKLARQEVSEIEACPDCYAHGRNLPRSQPSTWFIEPCRRPHLLVWAKLKGFPFWPAKAMSRVNAQGHVDVRFFGEHDRAWVPPKDIFLYSEEPPSPLPRKRKLDMDLCMEEISRHCQKLELEFGEFKFAPPKVQYNPNDSLQIKLMLPQYDPDNVHVKRKPIMRRRTPCIKLKSAETDTVPDIDETHNFKEDKLQNSTIKTYNEKRINENEKNSHHNEDANVKHKKKIKYNSVEIKNKMSPPKDDNTSIGDSDQMNSKKKTSVIKTMKNKLSNSITNSPNTRRVSMKKSVKNDKNIPERFQLSSPEIDVNTHKTTENNNININKSLLSNDSHNNSDSLEVTIEKRPNLVSKSGNKLNSSLLSNHNNYVESTIATEKSDMLAVSTTSSVQNRKSCKAVEREKYFSENYHANMNEFISNNELESKKINKNSCTNDVKESKAKKSYTYKSRDILKYPGPSSATVSKFISDISTTNEKNFNYFMTPPEAGPLSSQLYNNAHELARKMAQFMEEAYKEAALFSQNHENELAENCQATVHFLRLQIERMSWQHQQQLAELKHNTDRVLREMRASMEAEKLRAIEETLRVAETEKKCCIEETKRKQWCAKCGTEAMFHCCWNASYCNRLCQQSHWPEHIKICAQQSPVVSAPTDESQMPRLVTNISHNSNVTKA